MGVSIVLTIAEAIAGIVGGLTIGRMLEDSSFGKVVNAFIGLVGGVTVGYLVHNLPDLASSISEGSLGAILGSIICALVGARVLIVICALMKDNIGARRGPTEALNPTVVRLLMGLFLDQNACVK